MSEQLTVFAPDAPASHPIHLVVTDDLERNRLTVFFRLFLALPHFFWLAIWGIAVFFALIGAWFAGVVTGRVPDGIHAFMARWVRQVTHVNAYFSLAADPFPDFGAAPGYPVDLEIAPPEKQSRLTIFFRGLLAIPAFIVVYFLGYIAEIVMFFQWFIALFTGRVHEGLRGVILYWIRYAAQTYGYNMLLTQRYPSFSDE